MKKVMYENRTLIDLKNIGDKLASRLNEVGIFCEDELRALGAIKVHQMIQEKYPEERLPVCYYLYSFEGAIKNIHWNDLDTAKKEELKRAISNHHK